MRSHSSDPNQSDNSEAKEQLRRWLKDLGVSELNAKEQGAIGQLLAEFQDLPSASISPRLGAGYKVE